MKAMKRGSSLNQTSSLTSSPTTTMASNRVNLTELSLPTLLRTTTIRSETTSPESMRDTVVVAVREATTRTEIKLSLHKATSPTTTMALVTESCRGMMLFLFPKRSPTATSLATVEA